MENSGCQINRELKLVGGAKKTVFPSFVFDIIVSNYPDKHELFLIKHLLMINLAW